MLSISQNNICLPARAFKTINKIREHTMATVPLLPPSVSFFSFSPSIPSHFVLAHLPVQCRHSVVSLHLLSSGNFSTKPLMQADSNGTKINTKINTFMPKADFLCHTHTHVCTHTHTHSPCLQPTCSCAHYLLH